MRCPRIPTGFCLKAQGCKERAALGHRPQPFPTATRLRPFRTRGPVTPATTPLALFPFPDTWTQGSPEKSGQPWAEGHYPVGDLCKTGVAAPRQRAASLISLEMRRSADAPLRWTGVLQRFPLGLN